MRASTHRCVKLVYTLPCPTPCCLRTAAAAAVGATGSGVHSAADSPPWGALSQVGVRELLVQCVENVLRSHWAALGRGWHSAFEFIAAAGRDPARSVAALALRCVAPAPAALFAAVPAECVADCVHALAAFAANPHHLALRSVVCCEPCEWESTSERACVRERRYPSRAHRKQRSAGAQQADTHTSTLVCFARGGVGAGLGVAVSSSLVFFSSLVFNTVAPPSISLALTFTYTRVVRRGQSGCAGLHGGVRAPRVRGGARRRGFSAGDAGEGRRR